MRPQVKITNIAGSLGGSPPTNDGVCLLVHNAPTAYTHTETVFTSLAQAEQAGITEANDATRSYLLWEHIKDFFTVNPLGAELHLLQVPATTTFQQLFTVGHSANTLLQSTLAAKAGVIKTLGVSLVPASETHTTSISSDLQAAIPLAQAFCVAEYSRLRPISAVLEGRKFSGTASAALDLRGLAAGYVSVVVARNQTRATALGALAANFAAIGLALGSIAANHVGRNIGRVKNGTLPVQQAAFSDGRLPFKDIADQDLNTLSNKGYIFMDQYPEVSGWYWVDDHTCTLPDRNDAYLSLTRPANKAARIAIRTYVDNLKDEFRVDATTGRLPNIVVQTLQNELSNAIENEMISNPDPARVPEISAVTVRIDPNQNVLASSKIVARLRIVPLGIGRIIETEVELYNPANA
jgi:hypothetical protein